MKRTKTYLASLALLGTMFAAVAALPSAAAHENCTQDVIDRATLHEETSCGPCDKRNGPHSHYITAGPLKYNEQEIIGTITLTKSCSSPGPDDSRSCYTLGPDQRFALCI